MNPYGDDSPRRPSPLRNTGVRVGLVTGLIVIALHVFLLLVNRGSNEGDVLAWLLEMVVYFLAGRTAAEQHFQAQRDSFDPLRGMPGAAVGAALTTSLLVWIYIIGRGVFRDAFGITVLVEPISLYCMVVVDVLLALGLGTLGGRTVIGKYRGSADFH